MKKHCTGVENSFLLLSGFNILITHHILIYSEQRDRNCIDLYKASLIRGSRVSRYVIHFDPSFRPRIGTLLCKRNVSYMLSGFSSKCQDIAHSQAAGSVFVI